MMFDSLNSLEPALFHSTIQMAPSLEEPLYEAVADVLENPLKKKPELVAPEPGT